MRTPTRLQCQHAAPLIFGALGRALAPRRRMSVSRWAAEHRRLSSKASPAPGEWRNERNPPLREPMDCFSADSLVREVWLQWPIQFGKSEVAVNVLGEAMCNQPGPLMVCLPGEVSMNKWIAQKLNPLLDETQAVQDTLTTVASRDASNTRTFKDFAGGQLYLEHAGSSQRLKQTSARLIIVDELDEFAAQLRSGDDPVLMLEGRTTAFEETYKRLYISTPQMLSTSRIHEGFLKGDQRHWHVPCPHCGHRQPMEWEALHWSDQVHPEHGRRVWLTCGECGADIEERHKTAMIAAGAWVPHNPHARAGIRSYRINCLYYPVGLGPSWARLVEMWLDAQGDPAKLKTFINDRLAKPWADASARSHKPSLLLERALPYALRVAPHGVLRITAGVDTQDNRLALHITGWGRAMAAWTLDYVELDGDPEKSDVWAALTEILNRPILHACGAQLGVLATAIDAGGHRTEAVKHYVRSKRVQRPMCIFGAVPNNAPVLSRGKPADVTWRGKTDKRGVHTYQVGTVAIKHLLYARLGTDADAYAAWQQAAPVDGEEDTRGPLRLACNFTDQLPEMYFPGLISEVWNPSKNRFEKRRGPGAARNEPLDTWGYSYAATHHPELRLHRATRADWDRWERELLAAAPLPHPGTADRALAGLPGVSPSQPEGMPPGPAPAAPGIWHNYRGQRQAIGRRR